MVDMIDYYTNKQLKQQSNSRVLPLKRPIKQLTIVLQSTPRLAYNRYKQ